MRKIYIATRAIKSLKQSKARTILTALAIAVGATTICLALAAGNGGRDYIDRQLDDRGVNVRDIDVYSLGVDPVTDKAKAFCAEEMDAMKAIRGVESLRTEDDNEAFVEQPGCYYAVTLRAKTEGDIKNVVSTVIDQFTELQVISQKEQREAMFQVINVAQWGLIGFGALAVLASVFGIINTQYISVLERTRQIGLMKALGMKRADISRLFRYEAAWIGFLGGVIGVVVAWLITLLNPLINSFLHLADEVRLLIIDPLQAVILIVSLMLVAVLSGWFPARKAAKLDPIEALRTE